MTRFVVADLYALDDGLHRFVEPSDEIVLPHAIMSDIVGSARFEKHRTLFPRWFRQRGAGIWVAFEWQVLAEEERQGRDCSIGGAWRDDQLSTLLRASVHDAAVDWPALMEELRTSMFHASFEEGRGAFRELCADLASVVPELLDAESTRRLTKGLFLGEATALIRDPIWGPLWPQKFDAVYRTPDWLAALNRFPDVKAIGRVSRMLSWYGLTLAAGHTHDFGNNYEDTAYAFSASYTGFLATNDRRLTEMVNAVFPQVRILSRQQ